MILEVSKEEPLFLLLTSAAKYYQFDQWPLMKYMYKSKFNGL
jgi:hypothetical protein